MTSSGVAVATLRVPGDRFDRAIEALRRLGVVEGTEVHAEDVGEQYVDVAARLANGRRLEARLLRLLDTRTGRLSDVVAVERELARVREQVDVLEGRRRYLESQVAQSTIVIALHEPYVIVGTAAPGVMQRAAEDAWQNFVMVVAMLVRSVGVIVPLGLLTLAIWAATGSARRRIRPVRVGRGPEALLVSE